MSNEIVKKEFGEFAQVEVKIEEGKLIATQSIDLEKILDAGAEKTMKEIPGDWEVPLVQSICLMIKKNVLEMSNPSAPVAQAAAVEPQKA